MKVADGVVAGDEFLVQAGVFVVNPRVDHGDVDVLSSEAEVPCTNWIEGRVSSLDSRRLDVAVEYDVTVAFHHDHVLERSELEDERRIDLTQQHGINRFNDVNHAEIVGGEFGQMTVVDIHAVGEADPCGADIRSRLSWTALRFWSRAVRSHHGVLSLSQAGSA